MERLSKDSLLKIYTKSAGEEKNCLNLQNRSIRFETLSYLPTDPIAPYFGDVLKEKFGFGSAYLVFKNAEPVAAFKANTRNKTIDVTDYEGSEKGWRVVKEFAWEHQMPLQTELRIGGKKMN